MSLADEFARQAAAEQEEEPPARWPPCSRCGIREAKPGVACRHQLSEARCPWVLDGDGRIAQP